MYSRYIGIDSGLTGAIACIDNKGNPLLLEDLPTIELNELKWIDGPQFFDQLRRARMEVAEFLAVPAAQCLVTIELTQTFGMSDKASAKTVNGMGRTLGSMLSVVQIAEMPLQIVTPQSWKKALKLGKDKNESLFRARALLPGFADLLKRVKDHNRGEAALLAYYGYAFGAARNAA
ncbi:MAG TPA: hypothetical protein VEQ17_05890 [Steroidobacteraceae bacterium]|nr:hypothetical protein [Steroidobacteraceae bacterium]